jgi:hypothetical protein
MILGVADVAGPQTARIACAIAAAFALVGLLAACGGAGQKSYTYNFAGKAGDPRAAGIYLTVISPVKLPPSAFKSGRLVDHVTGPQDCAFAQRITKPPRKYAALDGTKLTVKVYGTSDAAKFICGVIRKSASVQIIHP